MERLYKLNLSKYFRNSRRFPHRPVEREVQWVCTPPPPQWTMNVQVLDKKVRYHKKKIYIYIYIYIHKWPSKCTAYSLKTTQYFKFLKGGRPPTPLESSMIFYVIQFYYIDAYEILGFFISLKNHIFIARSKDTIFIFHVWGYWCRHGY